MMKESARVLRSRFPKEEVETPRPVVVSGFDGELRGIAYCLKSDFIRRVTFPRQDGLKRRNVRDRPLKAAQKVELMLALGNLSLRDRIFLKCAK
jgi:hypothetical protein